MKYQVGQAIEVLSRTPRVLSGMLAGLSEPWIRNNYGASTFSPFDVVGHLIHGELTDWIPRAQMILQHQDNQAFEPFDRYAMYKASEGKSINELLDTFETLRNQNVETLRDMQLDASQLALPGKHPELGPVTLEALLATWVSHDLNHIHQIAKCMVYQYRDAVGAWRPYISLLPQ